MSLSPRSKTPSLPVAVAELGGVLQPRGVHGAGVVLRQAFHLAKKLCRVDIEPTCKLVSLVAQPGCIRQEEQAFLILEAGGPFQIGHLKQDPA